MQSRAYSNSSDEIGIRPDIPRSSPLCGLLTQAVGAAAASQQERLAIFEATLPQSI